MNRSVARLIFVHMTTVATKFSLTFPKKRGKHLIFSLPQTNHYHKISNLILAPSGCKTIVDKRWGNKLALFTLNDVIKEIKITFQYNPNSIKRNIDVNYKINDYKKSFLEQHRFLLSPNRFINGEDVSLKRLSESIISGEKNLMNIINRFYRFTLDYLNYGKPIEGLYTYKQAMEERITDCGGFSTFLISFLNSINIPARLVVGYIIKINRWQNLIPSNYQLTINNLLIHSWLEVLLPDDTWFPLDPSIDWRRRRGLTERKGGFGYTPADRLVTSFGCDFKININNKNYQIDLLQNPVYLDCNNRP